MRPRSSRSRLDPAYRDREALVPGPQPEVAPAWMLALEAVAEFCRLLSDLERFPHLAQLLLPRVGVAFGLLQDLFAPSELVAA